MTSGVESRSSTAWTEAVWLVRSGGQSVGPASLDQVRRGIEGGQIDPSAELQRVGTQEWVPAAVVLSGSAVARAPAPSMAMGEPIGTMPRTVPPGAGILRDLFRVMDGLPAHAAILLGLLLVLLAPVVTRTHLARAEAAAAELDHAQALMRIDFDEFQKQQRDAQAPYENALKTAQFHVLSAQASRSGEAKVVDQKKQKLNDIRSTMNPYRPDQAQLDALEAAKTDYDAEKAKLDTQDATIRDLQIKEAEAESKLLDFQAKNFESDAKALDAKRQELLLTYNIKALRRAEVDARTQSQGTTLSVHLQWTGRFLFLVGLIVLALNATGARQKIGAAIVILALFAWLMPVGFDFGLASKVAPPERNAAPAVATAAPAPAAPAPAAASSGD